MNGLTKKWVTAVALVVLIGSGLKEAYAQQEITWLGTLGGFDSEAKKVSRNGRVVVGTAQTTGGEFHAFRWENGVLQDLGTLGAPESNAYGVSDDGSVVVGAVVYNNINQRAFRWENGVMQDLGSPNNNFTQYIIAYSVSADGQVVVGVAREDATLYDQAFRWEKGTWQLLGALPGGYESIAYDVSADGSVVVGMALVEISPNVHAWHAFRWENGTMQDLGTLGGSESRAYAVSADGRVVVGTAQTANGAFHAFRWENGVMQDLGVLPGSSWSEAWDVSEDGSIVVGNDEVGAFLWTAQKGMENLSDVYGWPTTAVGISPDGRYIVGRGYNPNVQRPSEAYRLDIGRDLIVNSTADRSDQNPGDGACDTGQTVTRPDGSQEDECTLRAAIEEANAKQGADNIAFDIPVNDPGYDPALGIWTIRPGAALPAITEQVTIDGYTQPGAQPNTETSADSTKKETKATLKVVLNGQQAPKRTLAQGTAGLVLKNHQGSIIRGLVINGFAGDGIRIEGGGEHQILGNFIGTNAAGQARVPNGENGIRIVGSSGNYIGGPNAAARNLISGNGSMNSGGGVRIEEGAANNVVMHNLIGTDRTGKVALFNSAYGVALNGDSTIDNLVENNLISGNRDPQFVSTSCAGAGVYITAGAGGNGVAKNFIGTDTQGRQALPNSEGICVNGAGAANWIQENLISGNVGRGIWISGQAGANRESRGTTVSRNNIGAARDTSLNAFPERISALGNGIDGIQVEAAPAAEIRDNLIASNGRHGIYVRGDRAIQIIGNTIVANGGWGIYLENHQEGLIQRNGIGELTPRRINWRAPGGVVVQPDTSVDNRLARLSNGEGAIRLEGSQNNRIGGAAYLTEGNNLFVAKPGKNVVELIEDALTQTGANSNRLENNVVHGAGKGERGVLVVNSSDNIIRENSVWNFVRSGVAIREADGRSARRNRITETEFDLIGVFGFLGPPRAIDLEDDRKAERDDRDDQDEGPNRLQNRPEAAAYIDWNGDLVLVYRVDSDPNHAAYPLTVEVFTSLFFDPTALFLQALTYPQASAQQDVRMVLGKAAKFGVMAGDLLALTATDNKGNTSEFSLALVDSIDTATGLDFGDAPETGNPGDPVPFGYPTKLAQDGARHGAVFNIRLGQALDGEADGQPDPFLEGDDAQPVPDDEDGLLFHTPVRLPGVVDPFREPLPQLYAGVQEVTVLNTVSGYVNMWIDFNRDGDWDEPNEYVLKDVLVPTGPRRPRQQITVPATIQPGLTALRVRFTTVDDAATAVTGAAPDGEVEDHLVELLPLPEQPYIDFGDAPDSAAASGYPTLLANQRYPAAGHIVGGPLLGSLVDAEWDGQPDSTASGDGSDEDGVRLAGPLIRGQMAEMEVEVSGAEGYLSAWLDINQDGDWADSTEQIVRDQRLGPGRHRLSFWVPDTATVGRTYLRVRISSKDSLSFWGIAPDGEVEDYAVEVAPTTAIEGTQLPRQVALEAVYPNPARDRVTLRYALPQATRVRLVVYNVLGQVVRVVVDGRRGPGVYRAVLPVKDLPPGLYMVRLETEALSETRSLMILH